ncbi:MAG: cellulase family glycosylhydrolase [Oscillochloridaceae bacterium]|nr:cellulase family glycosylhydrolase [Chloroflexaceae bacterium]MDW8391210.1 cellulase family glycosylhydrolase [Oscillochloridaceae bacterium]
MRVRLARCWVLLPCAILLLFLTACGAGQPVAVSAPAPLPTARILREPEPEPLPPLRLNGAPDAGVGGSSVTAAGSASATAGPGASATAHASATALPGAPAAGPLSGGLPDEAWGRRGPGAGAQTGPGAPPASPAGPGDEIVVRLPTPGPASPGAPTLPPASTPPTALPFPGATVTPPPLDGAAAASTPLPTVAPPRDGPGGLPYPLTLTRLNFGVVGHLYYTDRVTALRKAREAGFTWFRQQIHWRDIEDASGAFFWGELDNIVADVNAAGMLLMINITRSPAWYTANGGDGLPRDPATLARFAGALAGRYSGRVHAILIWNEQNLAYENGGSIGPDDPGHFVEVMAAAYTAIKAADPRIIVVAGAPASTATNNPAIAMDTISYLRAMYSYKGGMIRDYFDVQALHPGGSANPPETLYPENPSNAQGWTDDPSFYFRHVENQRRVMEEAGLGNHQVWITEYGWATPNNTPGYEFGNQITFELQRDYIVGAIWYTFNHYPWVSNMFLWNLNFSVLQRENGRDPNHEQGSFSIVNADWSPRPAFWGIQEAIAQVRRLQP